MLTSELPQRAMSPEAQALEQAIAEVGIALNVAEARVERLLRAAFSNEHSATNGLRTIMKRTQSVEAAIRVIQSDSLQRRWLFGQTREGFLFFGERHAAREALAELPEALRELDQLNKKARDLKRGRQLHLAARQEHTGTHTFQLNHSQGHHQRMR